MKWLHTAVIVMGIMIIAGVTVIGVTIAHRLSSHSQPAHTREASAGDLTVKLPGGSKILEVGAAGNNLAVRLADAGQQEWIYIVEPETGRVLSRLKLDNR